MGGMSTATHPRPSDVVAGIDRAARKPKAKAMSAVEKARRLISRVDRSEEVIDSIIDDAKARLTEALPASRYLTAAIAKLDSARISAVNGVARVADPGGEEETPDNDA
jgi:hypothetical protein